MPKEIDEVSHKIGSLESALVGMEKNITKELAVLTRTLETGIASWGATDRKADKAHERLDSIVEPLDKAVANSNDWVEAKKKAKWLIIGGGAAGTAGGYSLGKTLSAIVGILGGH